MYLWQWTPSCQKTQRSKSNNPVNNQATVWANSVRREDGVCYWSSAFGSVTFNLCSPHNAVNRFHRTAGPALVSQSYRTIITASRETLQKIVISVITQLDAQNFCFTISLFHASTCSEHMCSKHVEARNKLIVKQKFCASSWLITEINILRCTVSKTSKLQKIYATILYSYPRFFLNPLFSELIYNFRCITSTWFLKFSFLNLKTLTYLLTYLLTPWCRVLLEKLTGL